MRQTNKKLTSKKIVLFIFIIALSSAFLRGSVLDFLASVLVVFGLFFLAKKLLRVFPSKKKMPKMTKEKEAYYSKLGMSHKEVVFFRETMATTKKQILSLETNMRNNSKLKAINLRYDTVKISQAMFKEIVKEPKKLHQSDRFLYSHLPNLVELTTKYIEINNHEFKNKDTYDALNKSAEAIEDVSQLIGKDYINFVQDDLDDLDIELSIAKQNMRRETTIDSLKKEKGVELNDR